MELLFEFIFDLIFEESIEIAKSRKVSKWIRYPLITLISLFLIAVIGFIGIVGIALLTSYEELLNIGAGIVLITIDIILIISVIKKELLNRNKE